MSQPKPVANSPRTAYKRAPKNRPPNASSDKPLPSITQSSRRRRHQRAAQTPSPGSSPVTPRNCSKQSPGPTYQSLAGQSATAAIDAAAGFVLQPRRGTRR